jgi:hypothetical protein
MITWDIEGIERKRARERHGLFRRGADTTALSPAFVEPSRNQSRTKCEGEHAARTHVSAIAPKDRRFSAACFSIRSTNALPVNEASNVQSAPIATNLMGPLKEVRLRLMVVIGITPV